MILSLLCLFSVSASLNGGFTMAGIIEEPGLNKANNGNLPLINPKIRLATDQTTPMSSSIPVSGTVPVANGTVPMANGTVPVANGTVPVANGTVPVANGTAPLGNGTAPAANSTTSMPTTKATETTTVTPVTKSTETTTVAPVTNSTETTTVTPVTNSTEITTIIPTTNSTIAPSPKSTTPEIKPGSTTVPVFSTNVTPVKDRHFDGPSFIGGIVLSLGTMAIGLVALKFYKARTEINYHTL